MSSKKYFSQSQPSFSVVMRTITLLPVLLLSIPQLAVAQITPDTTLGSENSSITSGVNSKNESVDLITGGATRGSSLFHSFLEFNVNNGQRVYFDNPANINNIFSRVTGNNVSHILGTLGVNGNANLYLLNPKGIIFGKDAKLDIQGSFFATTANSFKFPDGNEFSATNPQMPLLTMSVPVGVQFGSQPGDISSQGNLTTERDLTLRAGNLDLQGELTAGGNVTLAATGNINVNLISAIPDSGNAGSVDIRAKGDIIGNLISAASFQRTSNGNAGNIVLLSEQGKVVIKGGEYKTRNFALGTFLDSYSSDKQQAGNITIQARQDIDIGSNLNNPPSGAINASVLAKGDNVNAGTSGSIQISSTSGNITVNGGIFTNSTSIATSGNSSNSGDITLTAKQGAIAVNPNGTGAIITRSIAADNTGNAGNINIDGRQITINAKLLNISNPDVTTQSNQTGQAGSISLNSQTPMQLTGLKIGTDARNGNGGNVTINAPSVTLDQTQISTTTSGTGNAGNIYIQTTDADGLQLINNSSLKSSSLSTARGDAGFIDINAKDLILKNSILDSSTSGSGYAGYVLINAQNQVTLDSSQISTKVNAGAKGNNNWGYIQIESGFLSLINGSQIKALIEGSDAQSGKIAGEGSPGYIEIYVREATSLSGANTFIANSVGQGAVVVDDGTKTGYIHIETGSLSLTDGAHIDSSIAGTSNYAGDIEIKANNILLQGLPDQDIINNTGIFAVIQKEGTLNLNSPIDTGSITLTTDQLTIEDNAALSADTYGNGNAGNVIVNAQDIDLNNGGRISVSGLGIGNAGNITINAKNALTLQTEGRISSSVRPNAQGNAGDINITSPNINLNTQALIEVDSQNTDQNSSAGIITLNTNFLKLDNASITAKNTSGNGGDIEIRTQNLFLRNNSEISTTAGSPNKPGNGGKININAENGYVIAVPTENSDIIANAFGGNGGNIDISAIRVLGFETTGRLNTAQLEGIQTNGTSDISASSDVGTDGDVVIKTIKIDPSQGLVAIPTDLVDPSGLIAQGCNSNNSNSAQSQSEFVITGRGGLPPSPDDVLTAGALPAKWVTREKTISGMLPMQLKPPTAIKPLVEAQAMVRNANGDIVLIAQPVISTNFQSGKLCDIR